MRRKTIFSIYTSLGKVESFESMIHKKMPDINSRYIVDNSLLEDVRKAGYLTKNVMRKIFHHIEKAEDSGADIVIETCSSIGESVAGIQPFFSIPLVRIDRPMIEEAVSIGGSMAVIGTVATTMDPTIRLIDDIAEKGNKKVSIVSCLASKAFDALLGGDPERHDKLIMERISEIDEDCSVYILCQGSMAILADRIKEASGKKVLTSPELCLDYIKESWLRQT